ncbi:MAG: leucine-rich repeat domain-containing protein [Clostridia bacterium]|nr:leucine-rich repeat domain-containing protein [Clostridia bacterium]
MNIKRLIALLLVLVLSFALFACDEPTPSTPPAGSGDGGSGDGGSGDGGSGQAPGGGSGTEGGGSSGTPPPTTEFTFELSADGSYYIVTGARKITTTLIIPEEHEGKPVREIAPQAFRYAAEYVRKIVLPDSLTKVGETAFLGCGYVVHLTLGRNLTEVEGMLLESPPKEIYNRSSMTKEQVSAIVAMWETNLYSDTEGAPRLKDENDFLIQESGDEKILLTYIGSETALTLPAGITKIAAQAFYENRYITSVTMPDTVTLIEHGAFNWCTAMKSVKLSSSLTEIKDSAFACCVKLSSIELPNGLEKIGINAFSLCPLTTVTLPDSVKRVEQAAFEDCPLASITLSNSLTYIGTEAFSGCPLTAITLPASVNYISWKAFKDCSNLTRVVFEDPNGWLLSNDPADSTALADPETAATYLTQTYVEKAFRKPN